MNQESKFWMIWVQDRDISTKKYITLDDARIEAERLAKIPRNAGSKVWILEASCYVEVRNPPLMWTYYK